MTSSSFSLTMQIGCNYKKREKEEKKSSSFPCSEYCQNRNYKIQNVFSNSMGMNCIQIFFELFIVKFSRCQSQTFSKSGFFFRNHLTENCIILFLQILSLSSPEEELEVLVKLLDGKDLLDQQTLLITEQEGVFQFMPINTEAEELTVEVSQ